MAEQKATPDTVTERAKKVATEAQTQVGDTASSMASLVHKVLLAGVGAVALTKSEIEEFVAKLVERGEIAEQEGRKLLKDVMERRRNGAEAAEEKLEGQIDKLETALDQRIEGVLARLNVPTKSDIDGLSEKISMLAEKVDTLKKS
jgi:poly(hydroxyalkanoate) granule-associated protein